MIPLSLTLKGIYSYQEDQNIDFMRLTEANIFGIFGAVGSGKSTILEAISFALYGETERLNQRDNRNYNMMNLKSDELLIDYVFKTGSKDDEYRFIVKGKRNSKQFDKVGTYDRTAQKKEGNDWIPIDINTVESIVGLSYENFRRTIIIPQNKFQEFLQLGDSDRTKMMKEMFHLDKYELFNKVSLLDQENKLAKNTVDARLIQIGEVTTEQIQTKENQFKLLGETIEKDEKIVKGKQKTEIELKSLKETFDKVTLQTKKVTDLELKEPGIKKLENNIQEFEKCQLNFKAILENNRSISLKIKTKTEEIRLQTTKYNEGKVLISKKDTDFKLIKPKYEARDQLKRKSDEFEKIIKIIQLETEKKGLDEKIVIADTFIKEKDDQLKKFNLQQKNQKTDLSSYKKELPDLNELSAIRDWFTLRKGILKTIKDLEREESETLSDIKTVNKNQNKVITPTIVKLLPDLSEDPDAVEYIKNLKQAKNKIKKQIEDLDVTLQHLSTKNKLDEYAKSLTKGDPCPLCGSKEHPHMLDVSDVSKAIKKSNQVKSEHNDNIELIDQAIQDLTTVLKQVEAYTGTIDKVRKKCLAEKSNLEKHVKLFKWRKFDKEDEEAVNKAFKEAEKLQKQIKAIDDDLNKLDTEIKKNSEQKDKAEAKLKKIREDISGKTSSIELLTRQLKLLKYSDHKIAKIETLQKNISALDTEHKEIEKFFLQIEKEIKELQAGEHTLKGNIESGRKTLLEDENNQKKLDTKIRKLLKDHGYTSVELVETILKLNLNIEQERKKVTQYRQELHLSIETLKTLKEQVGNKKYDEEEHSKLKKEIQSLNENLDKLKGEKGSVENEVKLLKENLKIREALKKEQAELVLREEDINTLKQLFKGSGFVNYISSVYLKNLCKAANERFHKLTRQKLKLEITDTNNFQVRDFLNDGQVRSVKTLSGGQTFQAALSLALALADNIQKLTKSNQNFFFLDEGFGSLDKESLQIVFETLKALRKENRIVGVISHVEEMQQEIDTYLNILNEEGIGSVITTTWGKA
ncbi:MAG: hypothetical protein A3F72_15695 [Bacteroidetes bacterium RIFCSPLOWO2_12_FULL_35_15]|nr:MAG: hypothetical protein A3F72_15695 [Bacteroidetes bacterium RIFCSPLOWO2_12_FULL_35_15]